MVVENFLWLLDLENLVLAGAGHGNAGHWIFALRRSNIFTSYHDLSCQGFLWQMLHFRQFCRWISALIEEYMHHHP